MAERISATVVALAALSPMVAAATLPKLIGGFKMNEPATASIVSAGNTSTTSSWFPGEQGASGLLMTSFGFLSGDGVFAVPNAASLLSNPSTTKPQDIDTSIHWPNQALLAPSDAIVGRTVILEAGGFFPNPLKSTGQVVLTDITNSNPTHHQISTDKNGYFYHRALWKDMDGDGRMDVVAARANVPSIPLEPKKGELIWLQQPATMPLSSPWTEHVLISPTGPDVSFELLDLGPAKPPAIVAGQYFDAHQLALFYCPASSWSECNVTTGQKVQTKIIDGSVGPLFNVEVVDLDTDGKNDLLVTTNKDDNTGGVYVYTNANDPIQSEWTRHDLAIGFKPIHSAMPGAGGPGTARTFFPNLHNTLQKPSVLVSGDDNGTVVMLTPVSPNPGTWMYDIDRITTGSGTVGTPAIGDLNGDKYTDLVIPMYADNRVDVWSFAPTV